MTKPLPPLHQQPLLNPAKGELYTNIATISDTITWWKEVETIAKRQQGIQFRQSGTSLQRREPLEIKVPEREYPGHRETQQ